MAKETALEKASETGSSVVEQVIMEGDLKTLSPAARVSYYLELCRSLGLNPASRPFEYLTFQGKLVLYTRKDATDQLRRLRGVSIIDIRSEYIGDLYVVTVKAQTPDGRVDMDQGVLAVKHLSGEALGNALMKALTKGKRRVTLSICGLAMLDETEVSSVPGARPIRVDMETGEVLEPPAALPAGNAEQKAQLAERWRTLRARAKACGANIEACRPGPEMEVEDIESLLVAAEAIISEVEAGAREEAAA